MIGLRIRRSRLLYLLSLSALLWGFTARAQNESGAISGTLTDSAGSVLRGAQVSIPDKGVSAVTDQQGRFFIGGLSAGTYILSITYIGFERVMKTVAVTAGQSVDNFDENGFITSVRISISRSAFGNTLSFSKIQQLTEHEIGHALGIGHTNFNGDLMSVILSGKSRAISKCDINALLEANQWKIVEHSNAPHAPLRNYINCN